jgi:arylsulfotransferase ASST
MLRKSRLGALACCVALVASACAAADAGPRGLPTPRPAELRDSGTVSTFPMPDTPAASPATTLSFRGATPPQVQRVQVFGSLTGAHPGRVVAHSDGRGASFVPDEPFEAGEVVTVHSNLAVRGAQRGEFTFTIARPATGADVNVAPPAPRATTALPFATQPDLRPPTLKTNVSRPGTANGLILLTPNPTLGQATTDQSGPMIVDGRGRLVWFAPRDPATALDLERQQYQGQPVLSWWEGSVHSAGYGDGEYVLMDQTYREVARVRAGNGYQADLHDLEITPQNTALVMIYNPVLANAATINRVYDRAVIDAVVQEIDIATGSVLFEWHSLGNLELSESYFPVPARTSDAYDYVHPNSLALDRDGNIVMSARHTWGVYKIDRVTGALYWRLGGKRSNFDMGDGTAFSWQHDARPLDNGLMTVFDNAASAPGVASRDTSRGLTLRVDEQAMTVSLEDADENPQHALSLSQGDFQRLPNGDYFAGWGSVPEYTEFGPEGDVKLDVNINGGSASYRAFRVQWTGRPAEPPAVVAHVSGDALAIAASWNGATDVARWEVRVGADRASLHPVGSFPAGGFETSIRVPTASGARVVQVAALGPAGRVLGTSRTVNPG